MELDDDELAYTREHHTGQIRKKALKDCTEQELRIRCSFNERYIQELEKKIHSYEKSRKNDEKNFRKVKQELEDR